jgi:hypothetical protein
MNGSGAQNAGAYPGDMFFANPSLKKGATAYAAVAATQPEVLALVVQIVETLCSHWNY